MGRLDNTRQERFVLAVLERKSGSQAYRLAGYRAAERSAEAAASRLLRNGRVAARLEELRRDLAEKTEITVETIKRMLIGTSEAEPIWTEFLRKLTRRHRQSVHHGSTAAAKLRPMA